MTIQGVCLSLIAIGQVTKFFALVYMDINGVKKKEPKGFSGFISTIVTMAINLAILYGAGFWELCVETFR